MLDASTDKHDHAIQVIFQAIRKLLKPARLKAAGSVLRPKDN